MTNGIMNFFLLFLTILLFFVFFFSFPQCGDLPCDQTEIPKEKVTRVSDNFLLLSMLRQDFIPLSIHSFLLCKLMNFRCLTSIFKCIFNYCPFGLICSTVQCIFLWWFFFSFSHHHSIGHFSIDVDRCCE